MIAVVEAAVVAVQVVAVQAVKAVAAQTEVSTQIPDKQHCVSVGQVLSIALAPVVEVALQVVTAGFSVLQKGLPTWY